MKKWPAPNLHLRNSSKTCKSGASKVKSIWNRNRPLWTQLKVSWRRRSKTFKDLSLKTKCLGGCSPTWEAEKNKLTLCERSTSLDSSWRIPKTKSLRKGTLLRLVEVNLKKGLLSWRQRYPRPTISQVRKITKCKSKSTYWKQN